MRRSGTVPSAHGLAPEGHLCCTYTDREDLRARAGEYINDARAAGQWVEFVGGGGTDKLRAELASIDGGRELMDAEAGDVTPIEEFYAFVGVPGGAVDSRRTVTKQVEATEKALASGYTGLRAVVDVTTIAANAGQRDALARYEYLVDRAMRELPVAVMCAYDENQLGHAASLGLACLHPLTTSPGPRFRLFAESDAAFALGGELDIASEDLFADTMRRIGPCLDGPEVVVDGRSLEFIDHRSLLGLARSVREHGASLVLRDPWPGVLRILEALDIADIRVETRR